MLIYGAGHDSESFECILSQGAGNLIFLFYIYRCRVQLLRIHGHCTYFVIYDAIVLTALLNGSSRVGNLLTKWRLPAALRVVQSSVGRVCLCAKFGVHDSRALGAARRGLREGRAPRGAPSHLLRRVPVPRVVIVIVVAVAP